MKLAVCLFFAGVCVTSSLSSRDCGPAECFAACHDTGAPHPPIECDSTGCDCDQLGLGTLRKSQRSVDPISEEQLKANMDDMESFLSKRGGMGDLGNSGNQDDMTQQMRKRREDFSNGLMANNRVQKRGGSDFEDIFGDLFDSKVQKRGGSDFEDIFGDLFDSKVQKRGGSDFEDIFGDLFDSKVQKRGGFDLEDYVGDLFDSK